MDGAYERPVKSISELLDTCHIVTKIYRLKEIKEMKIKKQQEAAVMSWLDLDTPILPHRKFLSVYNSKISGFTELSTTKACVVGKITVTLSKYV